MKKNWFHNYPFHVPKELPPIDTKIITIFQKTCKEFHNKTAFINFNKKISFSQLERYSFQFATYLQSQGLEKGDVIVLQIPNISQYPISLWGAFISGLTVVNMNPYYTSREMLRQIKGTNAKSIVLLSNCVKKLEKIIHQTSLKLITIIELDGERDYLSKKNQMNIQSSFNSSPQSFSFFTALQLGAKEKAEVQYRDFDDTFLIQYTGGTTGIYKGACLSQRNLLAGSKMLEIWCSHSLKRGEGKALAGLPLFHIGGFIINGLFLFFYGVANLLIMDTRRTSDLISNMKKHPVTTGLGINTLFKSLLSDPEFRTLDFSRLKFFLTGGMSLDSIVSKKWKEVTKTPIVEIYGLTEANLVSCNDPQNPKEGYIGLPLSSTNIRIVNEKGKEVTQEQKGELQVKGPQVMKAYYKQAKETKNIFLLKAG